MTDSLIIAKPTSPQPSGDASSPSPSTQAVKKAAEPVMQSTPSTSNADAVEPSRQQRELRVLQAFVAETQSFLAKLSAANARPKQVEVTESANSKLTTVIGSGKLGMNFKLVHHMQNMNTQNSTWVHLELRPNLIDKVAGVRTKSVAIHIVSDTIRKQSYMIEYCSSGKGKRTEQLLINEATGGTIDAVTAEKIRQTFAAICSLCGTQSPLDFQHALTKVLDPFEV